MLLDAEEGEPPDRVETLDELMVVDALLLIATWAADLIVLAAFNRSRTSAAAEHFHC